MSNENKWTPAPWNTSYWIEQPNNRYKPMVAAGGVTIAIMHPEPVCQMSECEANAHLMAAAPDMYAALDMLMDATGPGDAEQLLAEERKNIMALLAKARGEQS